MQTLAAGVGPVPKIPAIFVPNPVSLVLAQGYIYDFRAQSSYFHGVTSLPLTRAVCRGLPCRPARLDRDEPGGARRDALRPGPLSLGDVPAPATR
ncbi:hypothetical protein ARTHRO8AJ_90048 [Arthrobacter sp. 8AJ]|nr:hypothetical protein ARTHRO8AJ_90048 [Arthrobacter sp. 8AJ]